MQFQTSRAFGAGGDGQRSQFGALCWRRRAGRVQILLITSRTTRRWIIPKGWPVDGLDPAGSAAREAWEEAGVEGHCAPECVGLYSYDKGVAKGVVPCAVSVFAIEVSRLARGFPERHERLRKWFAPSEARARVDEPELKALIDAFAPDAG